jgi:hypothetical protein
MLSSPLPLLGAGRVWTPLTASKCALNSGTETAGGSKVQFDEHVGPIGQHSSRSVLVNDLVWDMVRPWGQAEAVSWLKELHRRTFPAI